MQKIRKYQIGEILENLSKKNLNKLIIYKPKYLKFLKQMDLRKQQKYSQIVYF